MAELDSLANSICDVKTDGESAAAKGAAMASASLEADLQNERDGRKEERFIFIVIIVSLVDTILFMQLENWTGPVIIGLIQLIALMVYARRSNIDEIVQLMDRLIAVWSKQRE